MKYKIGVTGTGSLVGQGIIKSIKSSEKSNQYKLFGFDYFDNTVGSFWCSKNFILPDLLKENVIEEEWLSYLTDKVIEEKIQVLFIGVDFELPVLSKHKSKFEKLTSCKLIVSSEKVISIGNDKYLTYKFLKDNNLPYPLTYLPNELDGIETNFPLIVKPRIGARSVGVFKVHNKIELEHRIKSAKEPIIIQEYLGNNDTEYTCGVIFLDNKLFAQIPLKRSLKNGNTHLSEYSKLFSNKINEYVKNISEILKPYGSCNFQLRLDSNGNPKLFEINPRHSGTTYMRSLFGYNEVLFILEYLLEDKVSKFNLTEGKAIRYFEEKLV